MPCADCITCGLNEGPKIKGLNLTEDSDDCEQRPEHDQTTLDPKTWLWRVVLRSAFISSRLDEHICEAPIYLGGVAIHKVKEIEKNGGWCIIMLASLA